MDKLFWTRIHGGSTHFPIALLWASLLFDTLALFCQGSARRRDLHAAGFYSLILAAMGSTLAVASGLAMCKWQISFTGLLGTHHLFVWPSFALMVGLSVWRGTRGPSLESLASPQKSKRVFLFYLAGLLTASILIAFAGYWGGEMILG